jgi:hypothetical protein
MPWSDHMDNDVELHCTEDPAQWADACRASGQPIHPFLSFTFLQTVAPLTLSKFRPLIVRHHGTAVGVLPWLERRKGMLSVVNQLPFPYAGPLVPPDLMVPTLRAARRRGLRTGAVKQSFQFSPGVRLCEAEVGALGFQRATDSTYVVSVVDRDAMWSALSRSARKKIGASQRHGVVLSNSPEASVLGDVVASVCQAKGIAFGYRTPLAVPDGQLNRNGLRVHWSTPILHGQHLGSLVTLLYEGSAATWLGGILPQHRDTNAGVLMYWDALRWANEQGASTLDLVGLPDAGIDQFKRQFGGEKLHYLALYRGSQPVEAARTLVARARHRTRATSDLTDSPASPASARAVGRTFAARQIGIGVTDRTVVPVR